MHYETHVRFVDTHTESDGCHDDLHFLHEEGILVGRTRGSIHSGVVGTSRDAVYLEHLRQIFHFLARETIYYTALTLHAPDVANEVFVHIFRLRPYFVVEVGTVEAGLENGGIHHVEVLLDILLHFRRSCRCERDNRCLADTLNHRPDLAVLGAEIVSPLRDTMRLINGVEGNLHSFQKIDVLRFLQALGRKIEQFRFARHDIIPDGVNLSAAQTRVDKVRHALFLRIVTHRIDLVFHQRNQRRNDNRHAVHQQRRQLETEAFATAGRHQNKGVFALHNIPNNCLLIALKRIKTEVRLQCVYQFLMCYIHIYSSIWAQNYKKKCIYASIFQEKKHIKSIYIHSIYIEKVLFCAFLGFYHRHLPFPSRFSPSTGTTSPMGMVWLSYGEPS